MEAAETILADFFSGVRIIDVDEHLDSTKRPHGCMWAMVSCQCNREGTVRRNLFALSRRSSGKEQAHPVPGTVVANLVQPVSVFEDPRFNFLEA